MVRVVETNSNIQWFTKNSYMSRISGTILFVVCLTNL